MGKSTVSGINSITINGTNTHLFSTYDNSLYIKPIRSTDNGAVGTNSLFYNSALGEIFYKSNEIPTLTVSQISTYSFPENGYIANFSNGAYGSQILGYRIGTDCTDQIQELSLIQNLK